MFGLLRIKWFLMPGQRSPTPFFLIMLDVQKEQPKERSHIRLMAANIKHIMRFSIQVKTSGFGEKKGFRDKYHSFRYVTKELTRGRKLRLHGK